MRGEGVVAPSGGEAPRNSPWDDVEAGEWMILFQPELIAWLSFDQISAQGLEAPRQTGDEPCHTSWVR